MPINIVLLLLLLALIFRHKKPALCIKSIVLATVILLTCSFPPFSDSVMVSIENDYSPYTKQERHIDYIIILGCSHNTNPALPATSQLDSCSLQRTVEALRVFQLHPEARIITSGYGGINPISNAEAVKDSLILLGVPSHKIITESFPKDTEEEAELIAPRVQGTEVILITNADHMTRSMNYFKAQGISPFAAPTGYWVKNPDGNKAWNYYIPSSSAFRQTTVAWYESLGLFVQWFKALLN